MWTFGEHLSIKSLCDYQESNKNFDDILEKYDLIITEKYITTSKYLKNIIYIYK